MKKLIPLVLLFVLLFSGCCIIHDWQEPTCTEPETCAKCGKTDSRPLGHDWQDATCETAKTCADCGEKEGSALGHKWKDATCTEPKTCSACNKTEGTADGHSWKSASCTEPQTCKDCGATGDAAKGHEWREATCKGAKFCFNCRITEGEPLDHVWSEATSAVAPTCKLCGEMKPMDFPKNGRVFVGQNKSTGSQLTIKNTTAEGLYVMMKNSSGNVAFSFFVRPYKTAVVAVPTGYFLVYVAAGYDWYGTSYLFGDNTSYYDGGEYLDFYSYTWSYTV